MRVAVDCLVANMAESSVVFWTAGNSASLGSNLAGFYTGLFESAGLEYLDTIAWVRPGMNLGSKRVDHIRRNSTCYPARQWEPILVYRKPGKTKKMTPEGKRHMLSHRADVWEIPAVNCAGEEWDHPTIAPAEVPYRALCAYSGPGDIIADPFAGSGTTLMAVEKAGMDRQAFLIEISPAYCDIIIQRWKNLTGKEAVMLNQENPRP